MSAKSANGVAMIIIEKLMTFIALSDIFFRKQANKINPTNPPHELQIKSDVSHPPKPVNNCTTSNTADERIINKTYPPPEFYA